MDPVKTESTNVVAVLEGCHDLPLERIWIEEGSTGRHPGFESTWAPDEGERRALSNGAPVVVQIRGTAHPPIGVTVGDPDMGQAEPLANMGHVYRALGAFHRTLETRARQLGLTDDQTAIALGEPSTFLDIFERCLQETATPPGDGASVEDLSAGVAEPMDPAEE